MTNTLCDDVRAALDRAAEPGSTEGIAEFFRKRHIYGEPGNCSWCIISRYLRIEVPDVGYVSVHPDGDDRDGGVVDIGIDAEDNQHVPLPRKLNEFTLNFDNLTYPDLEDDSYRSDMIDMELGRALG